MRALIALTLSLLAISACAQPPLPGEEFIAEAEDFTEIHGTFHAATGVEGEAPIAILLHMYGRDRATWNPLIPHLTARGIAVAAIDLRGHGESTRREEETLDFRSQRAGGENLFTKMWMDVDATVAWLEKTHGDLLDMDRLALVGASVGCSVALDWSTRSDRAGTLVLLSPGFDYLEIDSVADIANTQTQSIWMISPGTEMGRPMLLTAAAHSAEIAADVTSTIVEGHSEHATDLFGVAEGLEEEIAERLSRALAPTPQEVTP